VGNSGSQQARSGAVRLDERERERRSSAAQRTARVLRVVLEPIVDVLGREHVIDVVQHDVRERIRIVRLPLRGRPTVGAGGRTVVGMTFRYPTTAAARSRSNPIMCQERQRLMPDECERVMVMTELVVSFAW
jgi:hypothetical protein